MWLLSFVPDSLLHTAVLATLFSGVALYVIGLLLNFWPPSLPYREPVRIAATVLTILGVYFYGGYENEMSWRNKVAELQAKVQISEQQSKDANKKLDDALKDKKQIITKTQVVIQERIKEVEKRIDSQCAVDPEVIKILNDAAKKPTK
jgi:uncharacterized protein YacL